MYLYGLECDEPKGETCCFDPQIKYDQNAYRHIVEVMCRTCGVKWEKKYEEQRWKMVRGAMEPEEVRERDVGVRTEFVSTGSGFRQIKKVLKQTGSVWDGVIGESASAILRDTTREVSKNICRKKTPDKYAPRPLSSDSLPSKSRRWFLPAILAIMTLLSGAVAILTITEKWVSIPKHSLIETSVQPYVGAIKMIGSNKPTQTRE